LTGLTLHEATGKQRFPQPFGLYPSGH